MFGVETVAVWTVAAEKVIPGGSRSIHGVHGSVSHSVAQGMRQIDSNIVGGVRGDGKRGGQRSRKETAVEESRKEAADRVEFSFTAVVTLCPPVLFLRVPHVIGFVTCALKVRETKRIKHTRLVLPRL